MIWLRDYAYVKIRQELLCMLKEVFGGFVFCTVLLIIITALQVPNAPVPRKGNEVLVPLACKPARMHTIEIQLLSSNLCCSGSNETIGKPTYELVERCHSLGLNDNCYSQQIFYLQEKHSVNMVEQADGTFKTCVFVRCAEMVRSLWYECNNKTDHNANHYRREFFQDKVVTKNINYVIKQ